MECERTRQWVSVALDSELSQFESALVKNHLARCADCRSFQESARAVTAVVRSSPSERMSRDLYLPVRRRVAWSSPTAVTRVGSAAAAVIVSLISLGLLNAPERGSLADEEVFAVAPLEPAITTNELLIGVRVRTLVRGENQAIAFGSGGIGAYKPALAPTP
ncbi:MAG: zf-HC2 domain-containing protein [Gaiellaceae bacterium MAG52_C11]|nr:zf-HC2 domain-containing protein [Candidatus Gaiellasilicea maunaloa]